MDRQGLTTDVSVSFSLLLEPVRYRPLTHNRVRHCPRNVAKKLSEQEIADLAAYYASQ